eukprot:CAMPEP_0202689814 /NCGR_PEP_ID=MMETSP1385-20130828/4998_1 /ASSEMBLY_ACC=CAM_ASM_000861 /TAXON_ID=933848 /ORGANISM="Elphidium margaritaceum" /LENGTH=496 /DNA_ID=CAMNT_0049345011 /DNA_START=67 /DNA_END=1557 /DNA_ORIENTATION=-
MADIGLWGLAVMGQNFALNIASKGFNISVTNRSDPKVQDTVERAKREKLDAKLKGYTDKKEFINSLKKPRAVIILVKAGQPVDDTITALAALMDEGDMIIDGGNEWYQNTERRAAAMEEKKILYMGMGVSGGEEGARFGPSLMPGGSKEGYERVQHILRAAAAKTADGTICCEYLGKGGAGNYVKMIHNGIEYGDMQLIAEAYDILKHVAGLNNAELAAVFDEWNKGDLDSFLIEITANIFKKKDDIQNDEKQEEQAYLVDKVLDKTGQKGTGLWTVKESAEQGIAAPTIAAALTARNLSSLKEERLKAAQKFVAPSVTAIAASERSKFVSDVKNALYASKICSYTQGMNLIRAMGVNKGWELNLGTIASIWKGGCIIRAQFLDRITAAYTRNAELCSLLMDEEFSKDIQKCEASWRSVVVSAIQNGIATPAFSASLAYYDSYRRERLPANLTQAQRDYFGAHTYQRVDGKPGQDDKGNTKFVHSEWSKSDEKQGK